MGFRFFGGLAVAALLISGGCHDTSHSPDPRARPLIEESDDTEIGLQAVDLVYVCGNKFLATNATLRPVQVTYRRSGTAETGGLTLPPGSPDDEGFSETPLEMTARGTVELYQDGALIARRRNGAIRCGAPALSAFMSGASAEAGSWTNPFPWIDVAVHLSLLPSGKVLSWGDARPPQIWDPQTETFTAVPSPVKVFCSGHAFLGDGRLLVAGGHITTNHGLPDITILTAGESWYRSTPMGRGRWYPTTTTLGNGGVVITGGRDEQSELVQEPEVWTPGGLRVLSTAGQTLPYYPRTFLAPDGRLFYAGEQVESKWLDVSGTGRWTVGPQQMYPTNRTYGAAVMYDDGKILYAGGARTTNTAEIIDLNSAAPAWQWTGSMAFPRRHLNGTLLPTGEVLVTGGTGGTTFNDLTQAVHPAEIWSPATGTWRTLASNVIDRGYHSTAVLLPDGRVLHTGSGSTGGAPNQENAEIFSPPYLFRGSRPTMTGVPAAVGYGAAFTVATTDADNIRKVSLIRLGSTTHAFDMNQRFRWLSFSAEAGSLRISAPTNPNRSPPGHYLLFILDGEDVPSVGRVIRVGTAGEPEPPPENAAPDADFSVSCTRLTCSFTDRSTDDGSVTSWDWSFGDGGTSSAPNPTRTYSTAGSYEVTLTVTDDRGATNRHTSTISVTAPAIVLTGTGRVDATRHYIDLTWTGVPGGTVDVYRNGKVLKTTANDGRDTNTRIYQGTATYVLKVCQAGTSVCSNEVTVRIAGIVLTGSGRADATRHYITLNWTGATGATVDVHRNGSFLKNTANDGRDTNGRNYRGAATYILKVCEAGRTVCSNAVTIRIP